MTIGQIALLVAVVLAVAFGLQRAYADGRFRGTHRVKGGPSGDEHDERADVWQLVSASGAAGVTPGERATLVQFSSAFCAPCRATRRVLHEVAGLVPGVVHVEVDAEHHLDLVRALGILRTPTTLVLDPTGREVTRASGAPSRDQVLAALVH